jgi:hypothetical protein
MVRPDGHGKQTQALDELEPSDEPQRQSTAGTALGYQ